MSREYLDTRNLVPGAAQIVLWRRVRPSSNWNSRGLCLVHLTPPSHDCIQKPLGEWARAARKKLLHTAVSDTQSFLAVRSQMTWAFLAKTILSVSLLQLPEKSVCRGKRDLEEELGHPDTCAV